MRTDRKTVAGVIGNYARVEIFKRAWQTFETFMAGCGEIIFVGNAGSGAPCEGEAKAEHELRAARRE